MKYEHKGASPEGASPEGASPEGANPANMQLPWSATTVPVNLPEPLKRLIANLQHPDPYRRACAVERLGRLPVVEGLGFVPKEMREATLRALQQPLQALMAALEDPYESVREAAAEALGQWRQPDALEALVRALHDTSLRVRQAAARALGKLGDARAVPPLLEALRYSHVAVSYAAATSLYELSTQIEKNRRPLAARMIVDILFVAILWVSFIMTTPMCCLGFIPLLFRKRLVVFLCRAIFPRMLFRQWTLAAPEEVTPEARTRLLLIGRLHKLAQEGGDEAAAEARRCLIHPAPHVRAEAAAVLGKLGDEVSVELLILLLGDYFRDVRRAAAIALGKVGDSRAKEPLFRLLTDVHREVQTAAAIALNGLGDDIGLLVMRASTGGQGQENEEAVCELIRRQERRALEPLRAMTFDVDPFVRRAARSSLRKLEAGLQALSKAALMEVTPATPGSEPVSDRALSVVELTPPDSVPLSSKALSPAEGEGEENG